MRGKRKEQEGTTAYFQVINTDGDSLTFAVRPTGQLAIQISRGLALFDIVAVGRALAAAKAYAGESGHED